MDVNVFVSAVIAPLGGPARLMRALRDGDVVVVVSPLLIGELTEVLARDRFRRWLTAAEAGG